MFPCSIKAISNKKLRKQGFFHKCGLKKDRFVLKEEVYLLLVCVCVSILFHREGFLRLQDVLDILEGTDQRCCVVSIIRKAAAKFPHLGI